MKEIPEWVFGYHSRSWRMTTRILHVGYFWLTMEGDCHDFVSKCISCPKHETSSTLNKRRCIIFTPLGLLPSGEWIYWDHLLLEKGKSSSLE